MNVKFYHTAECTYKVQIYKYIVKQQNKFKQPFNGWVDVTSGTYIVYDNELDLINVKGKSQRVFVLATELK